MTDFDSIQSRLRNLASAPVDDEVAERHLGALAFAVPATAPLRSRSRMVVAGALVAGSVLGSATLASAVTGNLPDAAQDVAHSALAKVGVDVPKGQAKKAEKARTSGADADSDKGVERFLEGCTNPDGSPFEGNHGQYVEAHPDVEATADVNERQMAAESRCGKPIQAGTGDEAGTTGDEPKSTEDHGKPDTAGSPGKSAEHKPDDAGKPATSGKPDTAGKPDGAGKPTTTTSTTTAE